MINKQRIKTIFLSIILLLISIMVKSQDMDLDLYSNFLISKNQTSFFILNNNQSRYTKEPVNSEFGLSFNSSKSWNKVFKTTFDLNAAYNHSWNKLKFYRLNIDQQISFANIKMGYYENSMGLIDTLTGTGGMLWSNNAQPLPRIALSTNNWVSIPFTKDYVQFQGILEHGWFEKDRYVKHVRLHHKNLYVKLGGDLPVNIFGGLIHAAQWGGTSPDENIGELSHDFKAYKEVFLARMQDTTNTSQPVNESYNRLGNHLGSWNYGFTVKFKKEHKLSFFYHSIFEDKSGYRRKYNRDGKWIFSYSNATFKLLSNVCFEYIHTKYQSGSSHTKGLSSGLDNYFNNYLYRSGWSVNQYTIGTPFITSPYYNENSIGFLNNRTEVYLLSIKGEYKKLNYLIRYAKSLNYGTYSAPVLTQNIKQNHCLINVQYRKEKMKYKLVIAADIGEYYGNNFTVMFGAAYKLIN